MIIPAMSVGGVGVISVAANLVPKYMHDMCKNYLDGNVKEAAKMQLDIMDLVDKLFIEVNPIPVKTAMNMVGWKVGSLRMPLCEMEESNAQKLHDSLARYGLLK